VKGSQVPMREEDRQTHATSDSADEQQEALLVAMHYLKTLNYSH